MKSEVTAVAVVSEVVEDTGRFLELEREWDDLYGRSRHATPFQSWSWLYSWWEAYGSGYELRLVTFRDDGVLVGVLPLMIQRRLGAGRLLFVGTGRTDYQDMVVRDGWEARVAPAVRPALERLTGWQVADLQQLRPAATAWDALSGWAGPRSCLAHEGSPVVEVRPWDELVAGLSRNHRSTVRRTLRRAEVDGLRLERAGPGDARRAARTLVDLHRELWRGRNMVSEHGSERWSAFIEAAAVRLMERGLADISEFWREGEVALSLFWVFGGDFVGFCHAGVSQSALRRYQWHALLVQAGNDLAHERGCPRLDLLRGAESYKLKWASETVPSHRLILARTSAAWTCYSAYNLMRRKVAAYMNSEAGPQWPRQAVRRLRRRLRHAARGME